MAAWCSISGADVPSSVLGWGSEGSVLLGAGPFVANAAHPRALGPVLPGTILPVRPPEPGPSGEARPPLLILGTEPDPAAVWLFHIPCRGRVAQAWISVGKNGN